LELSFVRGKEPKARFKQALIAWVVKQAKPKMKLIVVDEVGCWCWTKLVDGNGLTYNG
jgi:hypothetical protein